MDEYETLNQAYWDDRAPAHVESGYGIDELLADPDALSDVVAFDRTWLGDISGLDAVHLQCHIGTDTLGLARLGAKVTGLDLSGESLAAARELAERAGAEIEYVQAPVTRAAEVLGRRFDLVYTGVGAICWIPSMAEWARNVAGLLRPGGRLVMTEIHPLLQALTQVRLAEDPLDADQRPEWTRAGGLTLGLESSYFENAEGERWTDEVTYVATTVPLQRLTAVEWNHSLGDIVMALLAEGLRLDVLVEHRGVQFCPWPDLMQVGETGLWELKDRPGRLAGSFTIVATAT